MAFPNVVTGGRVTSSDGDTPAYAAGSVGDLIVVVASLAKAVPDGSTKYYDTSSLPTGWTLVAGGESGGADEYAKVIIARVADDTAAGTVAIPKPGGGFDSAVSYRFETGSWEGTINDGIYAVFTGSSSYNPPLCNPGVGSADIFWLAGLGSRETKYEFETTPTGFATLTDSRDTVSSNDNYSRVVAMEREENTTSIDPSAFSITAGSNTPEGVYSFTIAVIPQDSTRTGIRISNIKEANESDELVASASNVDVYVWDESGFDPGDSIDESAEPQNFVQSQSITDGVLEVELSGTTVGDEFVAKWVREVVAGDVRFGRATGTIIDLDA